MCLSNVYRVKKSENAAGAERELLVKNAATVAVQDGKLVFTDIMGVRTVIEAELDKVDLMENFILVK